MNLSEPFEPRLPRSLADRDPHPTSGVDGLSAGPRCDADNLAVRSARLEIPLRAIGAAVLAALSAGCAHTNYLLYPPGPVVTEEFKCSAAKMNNANTQSETANTIQQAVEFAKATRNGYAAFLRCREYQQLATGITVVGLTGGALGLAAAGIHEVTAAALGAAAGTGVGLNYVVYNKHKTMAYANAVAQLQCVIEKGEVAKGFIAEGAQSPLVKPLEKHQTKLRDVIPAPCGNVPEWQGVSAKKSILEDKIETTKTRAKELDKVLSGKILAVSRLIDVRAFAAAQEGVPDGERIKSAIEAIAAPIPEIEKEDTSAEAVLALSKALAAQQTKSGEQPSCDSKPEVVQAANTAIDAIEKAVDAIEIPDFGFEACLDGPGDFASAASSDEGKE